MSLVALFVYIVILLRLSGFLRPFTRRRGIKKPREGELPINGEQSGQLDAPGGVVVSGGVVGREVVEWCWEGLERAGVGRGE